MNVWTCFGNPKDMPRCHSSDDHDPHLRWISVQQCWTKKNAHWNHGERNTSKLFWGGVQAFHIDYIGQCFFGHHVVKASQWHNDLRNFNWEKWHLSIPENSLQIKNLNSAVGELPSWGRAWQSYPGEAWGDGEAHCSHGWMSMISMVSWWILS